jgi:hypothetical protein
MNIIMFLKSGIESILRKIGMKIDIKIHYERKDKMGFYS